MSQKVRRRSEQRQSQVFVQLNLLLLLPWAQSVLKGSILPICEENDQQR